LGRSPPKENRERRPYTAEFRGDDYQTSDSPQGGEGGGGGEHSNENRLSSSSTSSPATYNALEKASASHLTPLTNSINTTAKYSDSAIKSYGGNFVVCAIYLEKIDPIQSRTPDYKSVLISELRNKLQEMESKLYKLSLTDDIFEGF
jgi:hypothetical protein